MKFKEIYETQVKVFNTDSNIQKSNELDNYFNILYEMNLEDKIDLEEDNIGNSKNIKSNHLDKSEKSLFIISSEDEIMSDNIKQKDNLSEEIDDIKDINNNIDELFNGLKLEDKKDNLNNQLIEKIKKDNFSKKNNSDTTKTKLIIDEASSKNENEEISEESITNLTLSILDRFILKKKKPNKRKYEYPKEYNSQDDKKSFEENIKMKKKGWLENNE